MGRRGEETEVEEDVGPVRNHERLDHIVVEFVFFTSWWNSSLRIWGLFVVRWRECSWLSFRVN